MFFFPFYSYMYTNPFNPFSKFLTALKIKKVALSSVFGLLVVF